MISKKLRIKQAQENARRALASTPGSPAGALVLYDPTSGWNRAALLVRDDFRSAGLDPDVLLPPRPDYGTAFSRSILAIRPLIQGRGYTLLAAGAGPNGETRYSVVAVERNGVVTTDDRCTVQCPKDGRAPFVERSTADSDALAIAQWIVRATDERFDTYTSDDVRQSIVRTLDMFGCVPVRNAQPFVTYWAPAAAMVALKSLGATLEAMGWGSISMFEGAMTESNVAFASKSVNATLEAQLTAFAEEAAEFAGKAEQMRPSTIERRIEAAKKLREQADLYRAILGAAVMTVDERISEVETSLMATLGLIEAA